MRIIANLDQGLHGHIFAYVMFQQFSNPKPIHLIVDTGSTVTTLLSDDVTRLGINCSNLNLAPDPSATANGPVTPYLLPNVVLIIEVEHGLFNRNHSFMGFRLNTAQCMPPTNPMQITPQKIHDAYSLLGMDMLRLFKKWKWHHGQRILTLDT